MGEIVVALIDNGKRLSRHRRGGDGLSGRTGKARYEAQRYDEAALDQGRWPVDPLRLADARIDYVELRPGRPRTS